MFELKLEDLQTMIVGLTESKFEAPPNQFPRAINIKIDTVLNELRDIADNANAITWFTGYDPKVYLSEYIGSQLREIKSMLEAQNG